MRLPLTLLAVSAAALLASGSALPAVTAADQGLKVSNTADDLLGVGLNHGDVKRFLRSSGTADDEERLGGKNIFNIEKLDEALVDANYAKTLFRRWKRYGVTEAKAIRQFQTNGFKIDDNAKWLFQAYKDYLGSPKAIPNLFDTEKVYKASNNPTYANQLFGRWKRHGYDSDDVYTAFKKLYVNKDKKFVQVYEDYVVWLNIRYPLKKTKVTTADEFLFLSSRISRAETDEVFAARLFAKWKASELDEGSVYKNLLAVGLKEDAGNAPFKVYQDYVKWLHAMPAKATR
ncbi:hypothetical protein PHYPSEUDO_000494 [Phytophthora pseudosyringae]|uniref:RxLR effector protein n=1 Tax=Phytophthora pseudosyringae TaxID=221518 RepID=A0A8T1W252_9STRA|nr:hypothetical protein PHYPSEUDO_000494 [Phytophthora pseudosyringae]